MRKQEMQLPAVRERTDRTNVAVAEPEPAPLAGSAFDGTGYLTGLWQQLARQSPPPAPPQPVRQPRPERVRYGYD